MPIDSFDDVYRPINLYILFYRLLSLCVRTAPYADITYLVYLV